MKSREEAYIEFSQLIQDDENFHKQWHSYDPNKLKSNFYEWCLNYEDTKHIKWKVMDTVKHIRDDIYERDHIKAFENALAAKKISEYVSWMYMYTWKKSDGKLYDVFKHQLTRKNINVLMEGQ